MNSMRTTLMALLVSGACVAAAAPAIARGYDNGYGYNSGSSFSITIDLGSHPHWRPVRGTRVYEINGPRSYDAFRYGGYYYVYDNDCWYRSHRTRGQFVRIDDRAVPREFARVSRDHWRNVSWRDRYDQHDRNGWNDRDGHNDRNGWNDRDGWNDHNDDHGRGRHS